MKHIRISAREILEDLRAGMSDGALMEKYGLSVRSLPKVKAELLKLGLAPQTEVGSPSSPPVSGKISIKAKDFVKSFRETPDDFALMEKYSIKPGELQTVYQLLLAKGLLSEYEFHNRERKSSALQQMELPEIEDTTAVDLTERCSGALKNYLKIGSGFPNASSERSRSGTAGASSGSKSATGMPSSHRAGRPGDPCPQCGKPIAEESLETCQVCGVVFAKIERDRKPRGTAVWY